MPRKHHLRDLLERLTLILRADDRRTPGLLPTHRALLRYLGRANRYSNTPGAAALFLGQTKGTVSQSIALLERRGVVKKTSEPADGRVVRLRLTARGRRAIDRDPDGAEVALAHLAPAEARSAAAALEGLLRALQRATGGRPFGTCPSCRWFLANPEDTRCGLTRDALNDWETELLCVEHEGR